MEIINNKIRLDESAKNKFNKSFIEILFQMLLEKQQITKKEYDSLICALNRKFNNN